MIVREAITALVVAVLVASGFLIWVRRSKTRYKTIWIFMIVFAATWAGGVWIRPFGPQIGGVHWLTYILAGIIAIGLIGLFTPRRPPYGRQETLEKLEQMKKGEELERLTTMTLSVMFWVVFAIFILGIVFRYVITA
jgi:hypothetical protein